MLSDSENEEDIDDPVPRNIQNREEERALDAIMDRPRSPENWNVVSDVTIANPNQLAGVKDFTGKREVIGFDNLTPYQCFQKFFPDSVSFILPDNSVC